MISYKIPLVINNCSTVSDLLLLRILATTSIGGFSTIPSAWRDKTHNFASYELRTNQLSFGKISYVCWEATRIKKVQVTRKFHQECESRQAMSRHRRQRTFSMCANRPAAGPKWEKSIWEPLHKKDNQRDIRLTTILVVWQNPHSLAYFLS